MSRRQALILIVCVQDLLENYSLFLDSSFCGFQECRATSDAWLRDSVNGLALSQCQLKLLREEWGLTRLMDLLHVAGFAEQQLHGTPRSGEVLLEHT